jgi:hypothetical protein
MTGKPYKANLGHAVTNSLLQQANCILRFLLLLQDFGALFALLVMLSSV